MTEDCAHCGSIEAERTWDMRPCAIGESAAYALCDPCDIELNRLVLAFFRVADAAKLMAEYEAND